MGTKRPQTKFTITKHPKQNTQDFKMSNVTKCPKQQKAQITNCTKLQIVQSYKMSKLTKYPKLQNVQSYKMSKDTKCPKLQNVRRYKMSKVTKCPR